MVVDTLGPMDVTRRAYRLVGGVLVERTVGEVLPTVKANQEGILHVIQQLGKSQADKEMAAAEWKVSFFLAALFFCGEVFEYPELLFNTSK